MGFGKYSHTGVNHNELDSYNISVILYLHALVVLSPTQCYTVLATDLCTLKLASGLLLAKSALIALAQLHTIIH